MDQAAAAPPLKWYQGLEKYCWVVLVISALGWLFDTMDQNLFTLVRKPSMEDLLLSKEARAKLTPPEKAAFDKDVKDKGGTVTMIFMFGWAAGGFLFGILGDRLGRTKTMIITILIYAVCTGASGLVGNWMLYSAARFFTGLGVGGEWAAGAALVAETFPQRARPMALGLLQALSSVGNMMAAVITFVITSANFDWRVVYFVGAAPALLVLWIRRSVHEPEQWVHAKERASVGKEMGKIGELFSHPELRRRLIASVLLCTAGVAALWGVGFFSTDFVLTELERGGMDGKSRGQIKDVMFFLQNLGSFFGIYTFAILSERLNRRKAFLISYVMAWISILVFFWTIADTGAGAKVRALCLAPVLGFCTLMPFSGFTIYFPELFPTRLRTTGCGFAYNASRVLAAGAPKTLSWLAGVMATYEGGVLVKNGYAPAASIVAFIYLIGFLGTWLGPETRGKALPEDKDFDAAPEIKPLPAPGQP
ncbi:MAG: MFS transporter [Planctomycetes bacterium]|nr:MFS transporter [Planctomycetota bacterium]